MCLNLFHSEPEIAFESEPFVVSHGGRQIRWSVGGWRPSEELHALFREIGRLEHGEGLEERWVEEGFLEGLVSEWEIDD